MQKSASCFLSRMEFTSVLARKHLSGFHREHVTTEMLNGRKYLSARPGRGLYVCPANSGSFQHLCLQTGDRTVATSHCGTMGVKPICVGAWILGATRWCCPRTFLAFLSCVFNIPYVAEGFCLCLDVQCLLDAVPARKHYIIFGENLFLLLSSNTPRKHPEQTQRECLMVTVLLLRRRKAPLTRVNLTISCLASTFRTIRCLQN